MKIKLSKRLQEIAKMVKYPTMADIGTDHGHLPVYMMQEKLADKVLATDINPEPLARAKRNIAEAGLSSFVQMSQCNGLDGVNPSDYKTCVISGMGGRLIIDILRHNLACAHDFKQIVLSPQRDVGDVRLFLHHNGFCIDNEKMLEEKGKFYNILDVSPGHETYHDEKDYIFGKILLQKKCKVLKKFAEIEAEKARKIGRSELKGYLQLCLEVIKCL